MNHLKSFAPALALAALVASPSLAADSQAAAPSDAAHCVATAFDSQHDGANAEGAPVTECFDTFTDAILHATDGAVWVDPGVDFARQLDLIDEALLDAEGRGGAPLGNFIIAIDYNKKSYGGSTLTWTSASACTSGYVKYANTMPTGWNNKPSSTRGYSNCDENVHFEYTYRSLSGSVRTCWPDCSDLGAMNNDTSSREWTY